MRFLSFLVFVACITSSSPAHDSPVSREEQTYVIHAAAMGDLPVSPESIRNATMNSLAVAEENGIRSIAFPLLGAGVGGFSFDEAARIMVEAILEFLATDPQIETVTFYGYTPDQAAMLRRHLS